MSRKDKLSAIHAELQALQRRLDFARAVSWWDCATQDDLKRRINRLQIYRAKVERGEADRAVDLETGMGVEGALGSSETTVPKVTLIPGRSPAPPGNPDE